MPDQPTISVIGLGKLGSPIAAAWAASGYTVYGVDVDDRVIEMINAGEPPVQERDLDVYLSLGRGNLQASRATAQAVMASDVTFILVPTPSHAQSRRFVLDYVLPVCEQIGQGIAAKDTYHTVVLTSTVMPGATGGPILKTLERASGKTHGDGFGLVYSPEFVALGDVIQGFLCPDFLLIGYQNDRDRDYVTDLYLNVTTNTPPVAAMDWWSAEVTKLADNAFCCAKISFVNFLAELCDGSPTGNVDTITDALGLDRRISPHYLKGALSFGGPCYPRDLDALEAVGREMGAGCLVPSAIKTANDLHRYHLVTRVSRLAMTRGGPGATLGILGLSYKPGTPVIDESAGVHLVQTLAPARGVSFGRMCGFDPMAMDNVRALGLDADLDLAPSLDACVARSGILVITTPWPEFHELETLDLSGKTVLDCWRMLDWRLLDPGVEYIPYGAGMLAVHGE